MRIAVVEDDVSIASLLKRFLQREGYSVSLFSTGEAFLNAVFEYKERFDLVILDVMLPGMSGLEVLQFLRDRGENLPVLLLTALGEEDDKVEGLDRGADDYVVKPFSLKELLARVRALFRRSGLERGSYDRRSDFCFTPRGVVVEGKEVFLTPKEREILRVLVESRGKVVDKEQILLKVWSGGAVSVRVVDVHVKHLRDKLGGRIKTVWGKGYYID